MSGDRGTGRTMEMVESLPIGDDPLVVVVHAHHFKRYVADMVEDVRGGVTRRRCRFVVADQDGLEHLRGIRPDRVFVDHYVWESAPSSVREELEALLSRKRAA